MDQGSPLSSQLFTAPAPPPPPPVGVGSGVVPPGSLGGAGVGMPELAGGRGGAPGLGGASLSAMGGETQLPLNRESGGLPGFNDSGLTTPVTPATSVTPAASVETVKQEEVLRDSFGAVIKPEETKVDNTSSLPNFVNGILMTPPPVPKAPATSPEAGKPPEPPMVAAEKKEIKKKTASGGSGRAALTGLPLPVILIVHVVVICLIGIGVFLLWQSQYQKISQLNGEIVKKNDDLRRLQTELTGIQTELQLGQGGPVFVDASGKFSFYQEIPQLRVTQGEQGALVEYGEIVSGLPTHGFILQLSSNKTNGLALTDVVDQAMAKQVTGAVNQEKKDERTSDNKVGYSYLERGNDYWKIYYLLQNYVGSPNYVTMEYQMAGDQTEQANYSKVIGQILESLKIYE